MGHLFLQLLMYSLWAILLLFFFYTIVAIFKGASFVPTTHRRVARLLDLADISLVKNYSISAQGMVVSSLLPQRVAQCALVSRSIRSCASTAGC